ncbi:M28 family peptidase [Gracilimonas mengyeensis]|uniref:Zn-dependent amino-or carboxypeptidase, M28 family n=1 Tax=Gracilimonas mengyeensis TaxID=1302730 RepID=A0A521CFV7_9BACT|nr:M28 family peptidase [Gracilimonas mengyeensis]SMO58306.1 Zn-dependent amino-or carboxypeptidase, M28 family [Gracilimonas mengyeensis]
MPYRLSLFLPFLLLTISSCSPAEESKLSEPDITSHDIETHISFLASDDMRGRETGTPEEAAAANYIADLFRSYGLDPAGDEGSYIQPFTVNMAMASNPHASPDDSAGEKRLAKNVAGLLQGTGNTNNVIVIGAHYDHLGMGAFGSLSNGNERIHNGADDNASGTAGLLELAQYFAENRPESNLLFLAFSGEEIGLLGSQHYVANPTVELDEVIAMINMDMIGRLNEDRLMIFGVGTADNWESILTSANADSLDLELVEDGTGSSDHTSFYYKDIPVLHYFTDTHADYHRPSDDTEWINFDGQEKVVEHVARVVQTLDTLSRNELAFTKAPGQQRQTMRMDGPTLGVLPDYGFEGEGFRINGVNEDGPAAGAGLQPGDVIIQIGDISIKDIYEYMGALNEFSKGDQTTVTVSRNDETLTLNLQF